MQIVILGFGKMGRQIAKKLMDAGHQVVLWNRTKEVIENFKRENPEYIMKERLIVSRTVSEISDLAAKPRIIWSMLPAGESTNSMMQELENIAVQGDIVIDGGNAYFKDTDKRFEMFKEKGVRYLGIGVSGGVHGVENGFSLMVGGDQGAYHYIIPLLDSLAQPNAAHAYFGSGGAGHFVKMVHNGIEYGMMQALGEGFGVLARSNYGINVSDVAHIWQRGSIVQSFLLQMVIDAFSHDPGLEKTEGIIEATGEAKWTIEQAKEMHVPIYVIAQSLDFRNRSLYDKAVQETLAAKLIAAMRREFGGHEPPKPATTGFREDK